jgi:hypothetical protein
LAMTKADSTSATLTKTAVRIRVIRGAPKTLKNQAILRETIPRVKRELYPCPLPPYGLFYPLGL